MDIRKDNSFALILVGHNPVDPSLLADVLVSDNFFEFIYHVECYFNMHSVIGSGLIAGGKNCDGDWQTVFPTALDPMNKNWLEQEELDLTQPRLAPY